MGREHTACSSLLKQMGAALAGHEPMPARLVRGCIALAFTACVHARNHRLADTVKGCELRYTTLAMRREHTACSSLLRLMGAVLADSEPMLARLVRGCIALAFTACVPARNHRLADIPFIVCKLIILRNLGIYLYRISIAVRHISRDILRYIAIYCPCPSEII